MSNSLRHRGLKPTRLLCPRGFSRQEYWSGLPFPSPGDLPNPGIEPGSPALQIDTLPSAPPGTKEEAKVTQSCPTLCDPMGYSTHGILQARVPEWLAFPFSRGSSQPRDRTQVSRITGGFFTNWATGKVHKERNGAENRELGFSQQEAQHVQRCQAGQAGGFQEQVPGRGRGKGEDYCQGRTFWWEGLWVTRGTTIYLAT